MWTSANRTSSDRICAAPNYALLSSIGDIAKMKDIGSVESPSAWYSWKCDLNSTFFPPSADVPAGVPIIGQRDVHASLDNFSIEISQTNKRLAGAEHNSIHGLVSNVGLVVRAAIPAFKPKPKTTTPKSSGCVGNCSGAVSLTPVCGLLGVALGASIVASGWLAGC